MQIRSEGGSTAFKAIPINIERQLRFKIMPMHSDKQLAGGFSFLEPSNNAVPTRNASGRQN